MTASTATEPDALPRVVYTLDEAAEMLLLTRSTLYRMVKAKRVPCRKVTTRGVTFTADDIAKILEDSYRPPVKP